MNAFRGEEIIADIEEKEWYCPNCLRKLDKVIVGDECVGYVCNEQGHGCNDNRFDLDGVLTRY